MSVTLRDIGNECRNYPPGKPPAWGQKMLHAVPTADVVNRKLFLINKCRGKRVLSLGATGQSQVGIDYVASESYGTDLNDISEKERKLKKGFEVLDLDDVAVSLPDWKVDIVICGEVIEHLTNPGHVLRGLKKYGCEVVVTAPNAYSSAGTKCMSKGLEQINPDHVAWYSYSTLMCLLKRTGYDVIEWHWYNGEPLTAEGLIFVCEVRDG